ncbi:MAG: energy transducer TonB [Bacteroidota bacterium]|nr:energy transducer TonB [Bacteroidota bacterium]
MKYFRCALLALAALAGRPARAQQAVLPPKKTDYFDAHDHRLPSGAGAAYRLETVWRDSVAGSERAYFPSGKLKSVSMFGHLRQRFRHGLQTSWYENGQQHTKEDFRLGRRDGELLVYYPDGTLRRRELVAGGQPGKGECFGPDGQPVAYFPYFQPPVYSEGNGDVAAIVQSAIRRGNFPEVVAQMGMDARIRVQFTVSQEGRVEQVHALDWKPSQTYPRPVLDAFQRLKQEAEWMVAHLKPFHPALLDGEPVAYEMTVPIGFHVYDN